MLMPVMCTQCTNDLIAGVESFPPGGIPIETRVVPVQTVGLYRTICSRGHDVVMVADFQQFELLFESALEAFADTYFRESVSSFAAALERFYEFAIQTLLLAQGVDAPTITAMWKGVSNQSERQLGMFIGVYTSAHGRPPKLLPNNQISFRNNIIHKRHFPTSEEAFAFGKSVYELLNAGLKELRETFPDAMQQARDIARRAAFAGVKAGETPTTFGMGTTISLLVLDEPRPLHKAINAVAARLRRQRSPAVNEESPKATAV